jgi:hypothetical protein
MDSCIISSICSILFCRETPMIRKFYRYLFISVFLLSAIFKGIDFNETILLFSSLTGLETMLIKISLLGLILLEISIAGLTYLKTYNHNSVYRLILGLLSFFLVVSLVLYVSDVGNCGCFGTIITTTPLMSIIKNALLILIFYYMGRGGGRMVEGRTSSP